MASGELNSAGGADLAAGLDQDFEAARDTVSRQTSSGGVTALERWLIRRFLTKVGNPPFAIRLWNGEEIISPDVERKHTVTFRSRSALLRLMFNPSYELGELYMLGEMEIDGDLANFLELCYLALPAQTAYDTGWWYWPKDTSLRRARANVAHYEVGNEFYELWLDKGNMQYTCGYFPDPSMTLEEAQIAKLHHICRKLRLQPGMRVVEAGCGWGGLARFMATNYGVTVRAYNIAHEQIRYAQEKAKLAGLSDRVEYVEDDYRSIKGEYDVFVSVGMLEHIGVKNFPVLGAVIDRCLTKHGWGLMHGIGRNVPQPLNPWVEKRIYPGAFPPSLRQTMQVYEPYGFSVIDFENLRMHYVLTLRHWLTRYEENLDKVRQHYDENFVRLWRFYLCCSLASFSTAAMQLFQTVFARPLVNDLPSSRKYLYEH